LASDLEGVGVKAWWIVLLAVAGSGLARADQHNWFTVAGSGADARVDTVQVDPVAVGTDHSWRTMKVRVSRASVRKNWEGVPYRSYESLVAFDCRAGRAQYREASFYDEPLWSGPVKITTDYTNDPKPMLFKDMAPNPTTRIVRAACQKPS
jgi:hypothetical protein